MKPFIGIGITTYKDITGLKFARELYCIYERNLPRFTPDLVNIRSANYAVSRLEEFIDKWLTEIPYIVKEKRGGPIIDRGVYRVGAEWKKKSRGGGIADFRPEQKPEHANTIIIKHPYLLSASWLDFFKDLICICEPSYAMMHLFDENQIKGDPNNRFAVFDGPFAGEAHFTHWQANSGFWRKPDKWERNLRRTYRFLPELSWANFFGKEFHKQFDPDSLHQLAFNKIDYEFGLLCTITEAISDVTKRPELFHKNRLNMRKVFQEDFFRIPA